MRSSQTEILTLLRRWRATGRLENELEKITSTASERGMSDAEIDRLLRSWAAQFQHRRSTWTGTEAALADLAILLNGASNKKQKVWNRARRIAGWCMDHYVAVASMITVLATLFYGFAYTVFFQKLGITPEQAGLTPPWFLTRAALGGVGLTIGVGLAVYAYFVAAIPIRDDTTAEKIPGSPRRTLLNLLFTLVASAYLTIVILILGLPYKGAISIGLMPLVLFLFVSFRLRTPEGRRRPNPRPLKFDFDKYLALLLFPALPLGLLSAAAITIGAAYYYGDRVGSGYAVRAPKAFGIPLLGVRAEPALIDWNEGSPQPGFPSCALFIDGTDGASFLYDRRSRRTLEFKADVMGVELRNRADTCDAPFDRTRPTWERIHRATFRCGRGDWSTYLGPNFHYQWIREGSPVANGSPYPWIFKRREPLSAERVKCRVIASNKFGSDVAVSRRIHLSGAWPPPGTLDHRSGTADQGLDDRRSLG